MYFYKVALLHSSAPVLTYRASEVLTRGNVVSVPLKSTTKQAVVLAKTEVPTFETEAILAVSEYAYNDIQMQIAKFIAEYYFSSFSEAISLFLPYSVGGCTTRNLVPRMHCILDAYLPATTRDQTENGVVRAQHPTLSQEQQHAYEQLLQKDKALLFGVTGAGKTEIFIALMAKMLEEGKTTIFLMPEISLTPQMEKRLRAYFGDAVAMWHSKITKKKKEQILEGIKSGQIRIIAGARSALFTPMCDVGLIIVDEEHDDSYKAHTRPRYHARDVAVLMGQKLGAKVVLASATPSTTSYYKYDVVRLDRPYVQTRKRYRFIPGDGITAPIVYAIREHYEEGGQSLLFLPTRGNFKYLYCQNCGKTHTCPYCSVGMALHRKRRHLKCHYCNYTEAIRESCTHCGYTPLSSERIGTQEAIEVIEEAIEGIKIEQFDRDSITTANKLVKALKRFESGESHLLLGTQMLSKGHDYPNITLAIIMGLDHIMGMADYRSRERAMSLLFQIAGRSGRAKQAEVLIQTADPSQFEPYLGDYEQFLKDELLFLEIAEYPPFVSLARILIAHKDEAKAAKMTMDTVTKLKAFTQIEIVGHGKAPVERIANKYRFQILLRAKNRMPLLQALHAVDCREIEVDMDPVEFS